MKKVDELKNTKIILSKDMTSKQRSWKCFVLNTDYHCLEDFINLVMGELRFNSFKL